MYILHLLTLRSRSPQINSHQLSNSCPVGSVGPKT